MGSSRVVKAIHLEFLRALGLRDLCRFADRCSPREFGHMSSRGTDLDVNYSEMSYCTDRNHLHQDCNLVRSVPERAPSSIRSAPGDQLRKRRTENGPKIASDGRIAFLAPVFSLRPLEVAIRRFTRRETTASRVQGLWRGFASDCSGGVLENFAEIASAQASVDR